MIAAIYARKSTEQTGVSDEEKSVTRQIEHAKAYAAKKGWTVPDELVFVDDGISGSEFIMRPGFLRLMNSLKPKPPFEFLVMSEESRLGRDRICTEYSMLEIVEAGVRVFCNLTDQEVCMNDETSRLMGAVRHYASGKERERASQRTHDALVRKAKAGHVPGGKVFGYDNREVLSSSGQRIHVVHVVNEKEAAIVRMIFEMYASGLGITRIAKCLNVEGVPAPRQSSRGWAPCGVRATLSRVRYCGMIVYGQLQKVVRGGTKKRRRREENELTRVDAPHLRIIEPALWEAVQARLATSHTSTGPRFRDVETPYLLTGLCRCATCKGPITMSGPGSSKSHRREEKFYACSYHLK
jgi:site-specific DNA recombinase